MARISKARVQLELHAAMSAVLDSGHHQESETVMRPVIDPAESSTAVWLRTGARTLADGAVETIDLTAPALGYGGAAGRGPSGGAAGFSSIRTIYAANSGPGRLLLFGGGDAATFSGPMLDDDANQIAVSAGTPFIIGGGGSYPVSAGQRDFRLEAESGGGAVTYDLFLEGEA